MTGFDYYGIMLYKLLKGMFQMFRMMSPQKAVALIPDGAWIGLNPFLMLSEPFALHTALAERFEQLGHPNNLRIYSPCGFGVWDENRLVDRYAKAGALQCVVTSHYNSMPFIQKMAGEGALEAYCLPMGAMSHSLRAAAAGQMGLLSRVGLNIYVDPLLDGPGVNEKSREEWVRRVDVCGEPHLYYKVPKLDIALIKGTSVDPVGNICFSDECVTCDALALAQATKSNGGLVIVQVDRVSHIFERPRNVIIPGILVDVVVVVEDDESHETELKALRGDIHVPSSQMDYWMHKIQTESSGNRAQVADTAQEIIGERAARSLRPGDIVNIGIGIPEMVGKAAAKLGILRDIVLTVESGGIGGLPAPGYLFGSTIGADCIVGMAEQFDFYDGGSLSICFMGALEIDMAGNVNVHKLPGRFVGIGGFGNITGGAKTVVFCCTFNTKGLKVQRDEDGKIHIEREGSIPKFKRNIGTISFSAQNALKRGQRVIYVTERCIFALTEAGLVLETVFEGIDPVRDILNQLPFPVDFERSENE